MAQLESTPSDAAFSLSSVYTYWKEFDLDGRRTKLDEVRDFRILLYTTAVAVE